MQGICTTDQDNCSGGGYDGPDESVGVGEPAGVRRAITRELSGAQGNCDDDGGSSCGRQQVSVRRSEQKVRRWGKGRGIMGRVNGGGGGDG